MMDLVEGVSGVDQSIDLHAARLLLLIAVFSADEGQAIEGMTKLAKLDFLLRYPLMLERALKAKGRSIQGVDIEDHERHSVESAMVRYRFGPWDHSYREVLNVLVAKGLACVSVEGRTVVIGATERGKKIAIELESNELFTPYAQRARIVRRHFDMTATNLMSFIYTTFPEVVSLRSNATISA